MKKHWVEFTATIFGSVLVEGDETPKEASEYVKRNLSISSDCEGVDVEINEQQIQIENGNQS